MLLWKPRPLAVVTRTESTQEKATLTWSGVSAGFLDKKLANPVCVLLAGVAICIVAIQLPGLWLPLCDHQRLALFPSGNWSKSDMKSGRIGHICPQTDVVSERFLPCQGTD